MRALVVEQRPSVSINFPEAFARADFIAWLNKAEQLATWHNKGDTPGEYSDVFFYVDNNYEGSEQGNLPDDVWRRVCDAVYGALPMPLTDQVLVRLTNIDEED